METAQKENPLTMYEITIIRIRTFFKTVGETLTKLFCCKHNSVHRDDSEIELKDMLKTTSLRPHVIPSDDGKVIPKKDSLDEIIFVEKTDDPVHSFDDVVVDEVSFDDVVVDEVSFDNVAVGEVGKEKRDV